VQSYKCTNLVWYSRGESGRTHLTCPLCREARAVFVRRSGDGGDRECRPRVATTCAICVAHGGGAGCDPGIVEFDVPQRGPAEWWRAGRRRRQRRSGVRRRNDPAGDEQWPVRRRRGRRAAIVPAIPLHPIMHIMSARMGKPRRRRRPGPSPCAVPGRACTPSPRVDVSADVMSEGFSLEEALTWRGGASLFARGAARDPDRRPVHGKVRPGSREIGIPLLRSPRSDARGARAAAGHPKTRCGETVEPVRMLGCVRTGSTARRR